MSDEQKDKPVYDLRPVKRSDWFDLRNLQGVVTLGLVAPLLNKFISCMDGVKLPLFSLHLEYDDAENLAKKIRDDQPKNGYLMQLCQKIESFLKEEDEDNVHSFELNMNARYAKLLAGYVTGNRELDISKFTCQFSVPFSQEVVVALEKNNFFDDNQYLKLIHGKLSHHLANQTKEKVAA